MQRFSAVGVGFCFIFAGMKAIPILLLSMGLLACGQEKKQQEDSAARKAETPQQITPPDTIAQGRELFENNCASCHAIEMKIVGPALKNVSQRHEPEWLLRFTRNSQEMIREGDKAAVKVYNEHNKAVMSPFEHLTDEEIRAIFTYIASESD